MDALFAIFTSQALLVTLLAAAVQTGTPLLYATLGEIVTERSGIINLGVEGTMIVGAFFGFWGHLVTGSAWAGFAVAGLAGAAMGLLHGFLTITLRGNQVVSGLAITIMGLGLADHLGSPYVGMLTPGFSAFALPLVSDIPVLGPVLFQQDALVYLSYLLPPLLWFLLRHTRFGLGLRAAGENPLAVSVAGLSPVRIRWQGVFWGSMLMGLGGAYLSLAYTHMWTNSITGGRGWIAVALVIFAFWRPLRALWGAWLFSGLIALQMTMQAQGAAVSPTFLHMQPYLLTLLALVYSSVRGSGRGAPAMLGVNLEPED